VTYFIFDSLGAKILSFFLILIGIILITGKSIGEVIGRIGVKFGIFLKKQWKIFLLDLKEWKEERAENRKKQKESGTKKKKQDKPATIIDSNIETPPNEEDVVSEPLISSFTERAYPIQEAQPETT